MKLALDATALSQFRTGIGNYIFFILNSMTELRPSWDIYLLSNSTINYPESPRVYKNTTRPYMKGPIWYNIQLATALTKISPDVFWGTNGYLPLLSPKGTKKLLTIYDYVYKQSPKSLPLSSRLVRHFFQPLSIKTADKVISISQSTAEEMKTFSKRGADAIIKPVTNTIFSKAEKSEIEFVKKKFNLNQPYILALGTLEPRKNLENLIKAYINLTKLEINLPVLAIAGGKGWLDTSINQMIQTGQELGIIKKLGFVPEDCMNGLYSGAEAFIMPSLYEGFGMPVLEAQLCGTPVMISDIPSLQEASAGYALSFSPTYNGIYSFLNDYSENKFKLIRRPFSTIENDAKLAAASMIEIIEDLMDTQ